MRTFVAISLFALAPYTLAYELVFVGNPSTKTELVSDKVTQKNLNAARQQELQVAIVKKGARYFWKTREMKELEKHESGKFTTYLATDGAGYIKIDSNASQATAYIEHLTLGLNTITYQGWVVK